MRALLSAALVVCAAAAQAQSAAVAADAPGGAAGTPGSAGWQSCAAITGDSTARLACFDSWAQAQRDKSPVAATQSTTAPTLAAIAPPAVVPPPPQVAVNIDGGCHAGQYSNLSRFWELEGGSDCGVFGIRGYRPMSLSIIASNTVNKQPSSPSAGHTALTSTDYSTTENRIQLSVRTKIAQGLLTQGDARKDSLWFGYTQQSYWQLFSADLSRPFRSTDHEPELIYVYPTDLTLPGGWRMRYTGAAIVHQSNGQSLPLSRSWNRVYLMTGLERGNDFNIQARVWQRLHESPADDDNPDISDYIGRAEIAGYWNVNKDNTLGVTFRNSLRSPANGSIRLEWLKALGNGATASDSARTSGLRFHTQLFTGYGDSLIDYNRRRTVLSVGLSLVDF